MEILGSSGNADLLYDSLHVKAELLGGASEQEGNLKGKKRPTNAENRFKSKKRKT